MKKSDLVLYISNFEKALNKLKEGITIARDELDKDGIIQRFEFCFELFWKTLKNFLKFSGIECDSPRSSIKEAFKTGIVEDDEIFLDMLEDRNLSSHIYDDKISQEIFERIKNVYINSFEKTLKNLKEKMKI